MMETPGEDNREIMLLPTLLGLIRVRRPGLLTRVAGPGHGLLLLLLEAGQGRLGGAEGGQLVPAQVGGQRQRVLASVE